MEWIKGAVDCPERLDLTGDNVTSADVKQLLLAIKSSNIKTLRIHRAISLGDNECLLLRDLLRDSKTLQTLVVSESSITGNGAKVVLSGAVLSSSLKQLKLDVDHPVGDLNTALKQMSSSGFLVADADGKDFGKALFVVVVRKPTSLMSAELSLFGL